MQFEKTLRNVALLSRLREEKERELSIQDKISLAKDFMKKPVDRDEYLELEKMVKELERKQEMERKGFKEPNRIAPVEQLKEIFETADQEAEAAAVEYLKQQKKVRDIIGKYLDEVKEPLQKMAQIEDGYKKIDQMGMLVNYEFVVGRNKLCNAINQNPSIFHVSNANRRLKEEGGQ